MNLEIRTLLIAVIALNVICLASDNQNTPDVNNLVSLEDYLRYSELNNASLKAAFEQWKIAAEQIPQAKTLPDPKFTYEVETRRSPSGQTFGLSQMLPWFGTIEARTEAAKASEKAAEKRYQAQKLKLFADVKTAFYEYSYLARQVEIARENLELLKHFEEVARIRYTASETTHPDIILAQIELTTMENELKNIELMRKPTVIKLNSILNRQSTAMLPWPRRENLPEIMLNTDDIIALLIKNNPDLQAMDFDIGAARQQVELAKKRFYPEMEFGVNSMYRSEATMGPGREPLYGMVSLTLPIWRDSYNAAQQQAQADVRRSQQEKRETQNTTVARAGNLLYDFEVSARNSKLYKDVLIPKSKELLAACETAYQAGNIDFLSLIDAQRRLLKYELLYEQAVVENAQKLAELEMLVGTQISVVDTAGK